MILQETPAAQSCRGDHACAHVAARSICFEAVIKKMAIASYHLHLCIVVWLINFSLELPIKEGAIPLAVGFLSELSGNRSGRVCDLEWKLLWSLHIYSMHKTLSYVVCCNSWYAGIHMSVMPGVPICALLARMRNLKTPWSRKQTPTIELPSGHHKWPLHSW